MYLIRKWNEYMGPKDERLEAEENKSMKVASYILLVGSTMSLYYWIMVNQVANTTDHPVLTPLGASVVPVDLLLILTILAAGFASVGMQIRGGAFSSYKRYAEVDRIPWDYVASFALFCGAVLGVLTCGMRILGKSRSSASKTSHGSVTLPSAWCSSSWASSSALSPSPSPLTMPSSVAACSKTSSRIDKIRF